MVVYYLLPKEYSQEMKNSIILNVHRSPTLSPPLVGHVNVSLVASVCDVARQVQVDRLVSRAVAPVSAFASGPAVPFPAFLADRFAVSAAALSKPV